MTRMSSAEQRWRAKYPHTRLEVEQVIPGSLVRYTVYAGNYLCGQSTVRYRAFEYALEADAAGLITPDPDEKSMIENAPE